MAAASPPLKVLLSLRCSLTAVGRKFGYKSGRTLDIPLVF
jgi:hypothetical protein